LAYEKDPDTEPTESEPIEEEGGESTDPEPEVDEEDA